MKPSRPRAGKWYREKHLFGGDTYRCSVCRAVFRQSPAQCPACGAVMKKTADDPVWVDEMAEFDDIF
jgi:rubrerythrin